MAREIGDKLGPRLSRLFVGHHVSLRRQLAPIEAKIQAAATQQLIDRMGAEIAGLTRPLLSPLIAARASDMHPAMLDYLQRVTSGTHQWEAVAGNLQLGATSALSSVLSNYLWPATSVLNAVFRNLPVSAEQGAAAVAAGLAPYSQADLNAGEWGYTESAFRLMHELAQAIPGGPQIFDLLNRGVIGRAEAAGWLQRSALPTELIQPVLELATQLLGPADAALAVLRGNMTLEAGYAVAKANGLPAADFDILIGNTGEPPAVEEMLLLRRRGQVTDAELDRAIRQSRIRDEWIPFVKLLTITPPSGADVLNALVQGQIAEPEAVKRWAEAGEDPAWFKPALDSTANSPAPVELALMANRGIIPWDGKGPGVVSWEQGFLEGRWKDKWAPAYRAAAAYHPPPREIATLVREGGLTQDAAMKLWEQAGLTPELAHLYWTAAHYQRTSRAHELAQGEIIRLYTDKAITKVEALSMLEHIGWNATDAAWLIDIADLQLERSLLEKAATRIGSLYIAHKISKAEATRALADLEVPATEAAQRVKVWDLERGANVKVLTAAEIADAFHYSLMDGPEALAQLEGLGYPPLDAWYILAIKEKAAPPGLPKP